MKRCVQNDKNRLQEEQERFRFLVTMAVKDWSCRRGGVRSFCGSEWSHLFRMGSDDCLHIPQCASELPGGLLMHTLSSSDSIWTQFWIPQAWGCAWPCLPGSQLMLIVLRSQFNSHWFAIVLPPFPYWWGSPTNVELGLSSLNSVAECPFGSTAFISSFGVEAGPAAPDNACGWNGTQGEALSMSVFQGPSPGYWYVVGLRWGIETCIILKYSTWHLWSDKSEKEE